jgi:hypothetical protein
MLYDILDCVVPIDELCASDYAGDHAQYWNGATRNTIDVLNDTSGQLLRGLKHLRMGDTRTIIVRYSPSDRRLSNGLEVLADMRGCVMTLYPLTLRAGRKTTLSEVDPLAGKTRDWGDLLCTTLIHEMFHLKAGHDGKSTSTVAYPKQTYKN